MRQLSLFKGKRQRGVTPPSATEDALHFMIADILRLWCRPGWYYTHIPHGEKRSIATAKKLKDMGVIAGWPDFILLSPDRGAHFLELKRLKQGLSDTQQVFADYCCAFHYPHAVTDTFDDTLAVLKHWQAVRVQVGV